MTWGVTLAVEQDVRGLQIAVEDAALVGVMHGVGHLGDDARPPLGSLRSFSRCLSRPLALDQLHAEIALILNVATS